MPHSDDITPTRGRLAVGCHVRYGAAVGGLAAAVMGAIDVTAIVLTGSAIPWKLPILILGCYVLMGFVGGGVLAVAWSALSGRRDDRHPSETSRAQIRTACLLAAVTVIATVFVQRLTQSESGGGFANGLSWPAAVTGVIGILLAVGISKKLPTSRDPAADFVWQLACVILFAIVWEPYHLLYQSPRLGSVALAASAAYLGLVACGYFALRGLVRKLTKTLSVDSTWSCLASMTRVCGLGLALGYLTLWYTFETPVPTLAGPPPTATTAHAGPRPNVVLIVMDTVRADHLSTYGYHRDTTPHLTEFAKQAVQYDHAVASASWTTPSHATLFTGLLPSEHGVHWLKEEGAEKITAGALADGYTTLAEMLRDRSYETAAVVANIFALGEGCGLEQGFLHYDVRARRLLCRAEVRTMSPGRWICSFLQRFSSSDELGRSGDEINDAVFAWLDRRTEDPFFLFINYFDAHIPYTPRPDIKERLSSFPLFETSAAQAKPNEPLPPRVPQDYWDDLIDYDTQIAYVDERIGALFAELKRRGLYDDALIIVTSDHGEAFGEHGELGHNNSLYEEEVSVPLIVRYPKGKIVDRVERVTSLATLMPTVLEHLEIPFPADRESDGRDDSEVMAELWPNLEEKSHVIRAVWTPQGRKFVFETEPGGTEVFDLIDDPNETRNLATESVDLVERTRLKIDAWLAQPECNRTEGDTRLVVSEEMIASLRSLGYLP